MKLMAKQEKTAAELYREERKARIAKAAKKNAKKSHKVILSKGMKKAIAAVVVLAIVAGIGAFSVMNSGMLERGKTAFNVGDVEVTAPEYGFYYSSIFSNYFNMSYQYDTYYGAGMGAMYTGYDYTVSPDQQKYSGEIEGVEEPMFTDFFKSQAIDSLKYVKGSVKYAAENGIELDEEDYKEIEATVADFKETADSMNYSFSAYLRRFFHKGLTPALLEEIVKDQTIATKVSEVKTEEYAASYSDTKIEKTFYDSLTTYGVVSLRSYDIAAEKETVKAKEEGKEDTQEVTDKTMAAAKVKAEDFAAKVNTVESFKGAAAEAEKAAGNKEYAAFKNDDAKTAVAEITHGDLSYEASDEKFLKWAFGEDTKAGETYIVETKGTGYTVYMMEAPVHKAPDAKTYDVRHILVKFPEEDETDSAEETTETEEVKVELLDTSAYDVTVDNVVNEEYTNAELYIKAQDILKEYLDGAKTEEFFGELAVKYSEDGNAADGGIYEDVTEGYMVAEFENWALKEGREYGDVGIVETTYGYHIMFYIGSDLTTWSDVIRNDLGTEEYNELAEEISTGDNVAISAEVEDAVLGVEEFIVSLAKEQIRNINANAGHSADDGHNH
jgi:hypothetical protein